MIKVMDGNSSMGTMIPPLGSSRASPVRLRRAKPSFRSPDHFSAHDLDMSLLSIEHLVEGQDVRLLRVLPSTISPGSP